MNTSQLDALFSWFDRYVEPFLATDEEGEKNIRLKIVHTRKVCEVMELLAEGEQLSENDARLASATALLHDAGRFPQYRRWRTFRDSESDNHARLAVEPGHAPVVDRAERSREMARVVRNSQRDVSARLNLGWSTDFTGIGSAFSRIVFLPSLGLTFDPAASAKRRVSDVG